MATAFKAFIVVKVICIFIIRIGWGGQPKLYPCLTTVCHEVIRKELDKTESSVMAQTSKTYGKGEVGNEVGKASSTVSTYVGPI